MIPFLKRKDDVSISVSPDSIKREPDEDKEEDYDSLEAACEDLCNAIEKKDYKAMAAAWRAGFDLLEMQPHEEIHHG